MVGANVMTESDRRAVALYPELQRLIDIRELGWVFRVEPAGQLIVVKGLYLHTVGMVYWADMLEIRALTDAAAVRLNPDREVVWNVTGSLVDIIDGLCQLPHPSSPGAPRLVLGRVDRLWVPSS
jgi:hypothetical protein